MSCQFKRRPRFYSSAFMGLKREKVVGGRGRGTSVPSLQCEVDGVAHQGANGAQRLGSSGVLPADNWPRWVVAVEGEGWRDPPAQAVWSHAAAPARCLGSDVLVQAWSGTQAVVVGNGQMQWESRSKWDVA